MDQMIRTRNFRAQNERIETGVFVKSHKGKNVSVDKKSGEFWQWKANGQCSRGDSCSFRHGSDRGQRVQRSSLAPKAQTQVDGRMPSKALAPGEKVLVQGKVRKRAKITSSELVRNPSCDYWHPPVCQNYMSVSGCKFGDKCLLRQTEADGQPSRKSKNSGGKGSVALLKESIHLGLRVQDTEPLKKTILRKSGKLGSKVHRLSSPRAHGTTSKIGRKRVHRTK